MIKLEVATNVSGTQISIQTTEGVPVLNVEYCRDLKRLYVWDMSDPGDRGPEITIKLDQLQPKVMEDKC